MSHLKPDLSPWLAQSEWIDFAHPLVAETAHKLAQGANDEAALAQRCFEFVRDEIAHSWDVKRGPVTCKASDVLQHRTGYCYAKSHLLAALLRANGLPAGFCYQRLSVGDAGAPYCLHGLNALYLQEHGWYRIDARGNKPGVSARFSPPQEALAFAIREGDEADLPGNLAEPPPLIVAALQAHGDIFKLHAHLPDMAPLAWLSSTAPNAWAHRAHPTPTQAA